METFQNFFKGSGPTSVIVSADGSGKPYIYESEMTLTLTLTATLKSLTYFSFAAGKGMLTGVAHTAMFFQRIAPKGVMPGTVEVTTLSLTAPSNVLLTLLTFFVHPLG